MSYDYEVLERHYNLAIKERDEARNLAEEWEEMARDGMVFDVDAVIKQRDDLQLKLQEARKLAEEWRDRSRRYRKLANPNLADCAFGLPWEGGALGIALDETRMERDEERRLKEEARKLAEHYRDSWLEIDRTVCDVAGVGPCSPNRLPWEEK